MRIVSEPVRWEIVALTRSSPGSMPRSNTVRPLVLVTVRDTKLASE